MKILFQSQLHNVELEGNDIGEIKELIQVMPELNKTLGQKEELVVSEDSYEANHIFCQTCGEFIDNCVCIAEMSEEEAVQTRNVPGQISIGHPVQIAPLVQPQRTTSRLEDILSNITSSTRTATPEEILSPEPVQAQEQVRPTLSISNDYVPVQQPVQVQPSLEDILGAISSTEAPTDNQSIERAVTQMVDFLKRNNQ